jgi:hypothetical protein
VVGAHLGRATLTRGKQGRGALFDADREYISIPTRRGSKQLNVFNKDKGTIDFWYKPRHRHNDHKKHIFFYSWRNRKNSFYFMKRKNDRLYIIFNDNGRWVSDYVNPRDYSWKPNQWVHLTFVWDKDAPKGKTMRIFINGKEPKQRNWRAYRGRFQGPGRHLLISSWSKGRSADGIIDEFKIYNRVVLP